MFDQLLANSLFQRYVIEGGPVMYRGAAVADHAGGGAGRAIAAQRARHAARLIKQAPPWTDAAGGGNSSGAGRRPEAAGRVVCYAEGPPARPETAALKSWRRNCRGDGGGLRRDSRRDRPAVDDLHRARCWPAGGTILGKMNGSTRCAQVAAEQTVARLSEGSSRPGDDHVRAWPSPSRPLSPRSVAGWIRAMSASLCPTRRSGLNRIDYWRGGEASRRAGRRGHEPNHETWPRSSRAAAQRRKSRRPHLNRASALTRCWTCFQLLSSLC